MAVMLTQIKVLQPFGGFFDVVARFDDVFGSIPAHMVLCHVQGPLSSLGRGALQGHEHQTIRDFHLIRYGIGDQAR